MLEEFEFACRASFSWDSKPASLDVKSIRRSEQGTYRYELYIQIKYIDGQSPSPPVCMSVNRAEFSPKAR